MMGKRLYVDLEKCNNCAECTVKCAYFYHPKDQGVISLREMATFALTCRKCEQPLCVASCPKDALEKDSDGLIKRYRMRCVSCKSCVSACPFGTIIAEIVPYIDARCDYCLRKGDAPGCVRGCAQNAIEFKEIEQDEKKHIFMVNDKLVVHAIPWKKE